jgi:argininosuccinate synthase
VRVRLYKGHMLVEGCRSPYSLLDRKVGTYGETNRAWTGAEAAAFCKLYGLQSVLAHRRQAEAGGAEAPAVAAVLAPRSLSHASKGR